MMGRTARKVAALLEALGFSEVRLHAMQGHWRTSPYADVHRWEGLAIRDGQRVALYSWNTMTQCAKGIVVSERDKGSSGHGYEVHAQ